MHDNPEPIFEVAPATSNDDDNGRQRFFNTMATHSSDHSHMASGSTSPTCFTVDTESLSGSLASRSIVSSLTSSSITLNSDKEAFLRNALRRAKLLQEYHSKREQEEVALPPPQPSPEPWSSQDDELYSGAGYHYEKGIIQIENARVNARHAPRKLKTQFRHAKSDDIVDSMLLQRRPLLQRRNSIDTTLQRISQEQDRCRERLRLLKAVSKSSHQCVDQVQVANKIISESLSDFVEDDDDDSSGYFSSDSASQSTGSVEEVTTINDVSTLDDTATASNMQGNGCDYAFVIFPAPSSEKDLHAKSQETMSTKGSSPQTLPGANGADLSTEEMSYLIPISLFEGDEASSSIDQFDDHSSSAKSREFQDVWAWFGNEDSPEMVVTKRSKTRRAQIMKKSSKILCFRKNKRKSYAAMDDRMSLLSEVQLI